MFCTFTTENGALIIRSEDLRSIADRVDGCAVMYVVADQVYSAAIAGTATENLARLRAEELAAIEQAQKLQQRAADKLPILPIARGKAR
jgi:hypothetical protein